MKSVSMPLNFNSIFEYLGQFTIRCIYQYSFKKTKQKQKQKNKNGVDTFEIEHKTC